MPYVDETYYSSTYYGEAVTPVEEWPRYEMRAEETIDQITFYRVRQAGLEAFPQFIQTLVKKAVCAQIEFYVEYGINAAIDGKSDKGFTVGKVRVDGDGNSQSGGGAEFVSPQAIAYLEQTGLLNPQVVTLC